MRLAAAVLLGLAPGYEPRYAFPLLYRQLGLAAALLVAGLEAVLLAAVLTLAAGQAWRLLLWAAERNGLAAKVAARVEAARGRARSLVERYGVVGLAVFVALPVPVTGIYTGAVVAELLGLDRWRSFLALAVGGAASVSIVAAATLLGVSLARL